MASTNLTLRKPVTRTAAQIADPSHIPGATMIWEGDPTGVISAHRGDATDAPVELRTKFVGDDDYPPAPGNVKGRLTGPARKGDAR